jgi:ribonuclease HI
MKRAVIHADGACFGNPGPAGIGVVVELEGHTSEISRSIGQATNNIAEYSALIAGLEEASRLGAEAVDVRLDSELAVKQMLGKYKVKNEGLKPLFRKAKTLSKSFKKFSIRHVPREENTRADKLSKMGAEGKDTHTSTGTAPAPSATQSTPGTGGQGELF